MKPSKQLKLRRDVMTDLATDELRGIVGADSLVPCIIDLTGQITLCRKCPSDPVTGCTIIQETSDCLATVTCPTDFCS